MRSSARKPVREPVQARARRRRESILDATAQILDRDGYDALTTNAVARAAGTGVGTVYEYFPHRDALLRGLLARHAERLATVMDRIGAGADHDPLDVMDGIVDAFARFWRDEPGYRSAWAIARVSGLLVEAGAAWSDRFTADVARLLGAFVSTSPPRQRRLVARTIVHLVSGLLQGAIEGGRDSGALVEETKVALRGYLRARLPELFARGGAARSRRG